MIYLRLTLKISFIVILIIIGLIVTVSLARNNDMYQELPDEEKILYGFINDQGKVLGKKYQMRQNGIGLGGMDKVWLMSLSFEKLGPPLNENEARKLIIQCVDDFLEAVNNNEKLRPSLKDYPFTAKNLDLTIINFDLHRNLYYFPSITVVTDIEGKIGYFTENPSTKHGYHTKKYETYEEAVAILKKEN